MKATDTVIRVVIFREGDHYIAQGLEVDLCAQGRDLEEAEKRFGVVLRAELREAKQRGASIFDIGPAPAVFHALYDNSSISRSEALVA
ncbi:hypothetical protein H2509_20635 [Stappia sp. F7233]|uniref:Type II toxin-antitoxin system HicB family antitoxin n=1 Tax=Stappia albiluteola TaxID=2758565 RepID=A0A839AK77_9HYPH|nr:hypothetical protein [Stappia albiluteola]MBA5779545.1 hypothetical protein [Stappia albiluteola]